MKKSKKNSLAAAGMILVLLLAGVIFFFTYYQVDEVQVMGSSHYSEKQIKKMVLRGPLASNSVLAPLLYTKQNTKDVPFVDGYTVTRLNRHTICVSVKRRILSAVFLIWTVTFTLTEMEFLWKVPQNAMRRFRFLTELK